MLIALACAWLPSVGLANQLSSDDPPAAAVVKAEWKQLLGETFTAEAIAPLQEAVARSTAAGFELQLALAQFELARALSLKQRPSPEDEALVRPLLNRSLPILARELTATDPRRLRAAALVYRLFLEDDYLPRGVLTDIPHRRLPTAEELAKIDPLTAAIRDGKGRESLLAAYTELLDLSLATFGPQHSFTANILVSGLKSHQEGTAWEAPSLAALGIYARSADPAGGFAPEALWYVLRTKQIYRETDEAYNLLACYVALGSRADDPERILNALEQDPAGTELEGDLATRLRASRAVAPKLSDCERMLPLANDHAIRGLLGDSAYQADAKRDERPSDSSIDGRAEAVIGELGNKRDRAEFMHARRKLEAGIAVVEKALGPKSGDALDYRFRLGAEYAWFAGEVPRDEQSSLFAKRARELLTPLIGEFEVRPEKDSALRLVKSALADALEVERDLTGAERLLVEAAAHSETAHGPFHRDTLRTRYRLAQFYEDAGRDSSAEQILKELVKNGDAAAFLEGEDSTALLIRLAENLNRQGKIPEARQLFAQALATRQKLLGGSDRRTTEVANRLRSIETPGAASVARPEHPDRTSVALHNAVDFEEFYELYYAIEERVRADDLRRAEQLSKELLSYSETRSASIEAYKPKVLEVLLQRAGISARLGLEAEREAALRRALLNAEALYGTSSNMLVSYLEELVSYLIGNDRFVEAEKLSRRGLAIATGKDLEHLLAESLEGQGRYGDAEPLRLRMNIAAPLAYNLLAQGKVEEARRFYDAATTKTLKFGRTGEEVDVLLRLDRPIEAQRLAIREKREFETKYGAGSRVALLAALALAATNARAGEWNYVRSGLESVCKQLAATTGGSAWTASGRRTLSKCWQLLAVARQRAGDPELAFDAAQRSQLSDAGAAVSKAGARIAAARVGASQLVDERDALLRQLSLLQKEEEEAIEKGVDAQWPRRLLADRRTRLASELARISDAIGRQFPSYWNLVSPEPVSFAELRGDAGKKPLLRAGEALVFIFIPDGDARGFVTAVSRESVVSADIGAGSPEISSAVRDLRRQLDPRSYGLRSGGGRDATLESGPEPAAEARAFDRQIAHNLYVKLLGDPAVQSAIGPARTLLFVPTGALTSFPPALLVTAPPPGKDDDSNAVRSTRWLVKDKSLAVIPTVSAFKTLRTMTRDRRVGPSRPLKIFADPDFTAGANAIPAPAAHGVAEQRGPSDAAYFFRDGGADPSRLAMLPRLPGTRREARDLALQLGASENDVYLDAAASEQQVMSLSETGVLGSARVVSFATHGLVAGEMSGLAEPALALSPSPGGSSDASGDGLLTSSEASALRLNADWVLLSACNTASPDSVNAQGLSGLTRSFFFAGARSVLASHWRVGDVAAEKIVTGTFRGQQKGLNKAEALRASMLAVMADPGMERSWTPTFWAPFVLYGEVD